RLQIDPPEEHFRSLGLEQDLALRVTGLGANVHDLAVEDVGQLVAVADALEGVPFADGLFDIFFAAEAFHVFPLGVAAVPVDPAAGELLGGSAGLVVPLLPALLGLGGDFRLALAADQDDVAGASLDHLALDRFHPGAAGRAILANAV